MRTRFLLPLVSLLAALSTPARAAFNNGVETFNGTSLDLANWQVFSWQGGTPMTQNNNLTISCLVPVQSNYTNYADYTSRVQTVAVGQRFSVDVTVNQYSTSVGWGRYVGLYLTTNSAGTTHNTEWDNYKFYIWNDADHNAVQWRYGDANRGFGGNLLPQSQPASSTYHYIIDRLTDSSACFTVTDSANNLLASQTADLLGFDYYPIAAHPDPLFISLFVEGASATFDNVTVSAIPEPASLALLAPSLALLLPRRRKQTNLDGPGNRVGV